MSCRVGLYLTATSSTHCLAVSSRGGTGIGTRMRSKRSVRMLKDGELLKPKGVIVALEHGTRLMVRDCIREIDVSVWLAPGQVLVFDGDVVHGGAEYEYSNTRVHMYLEVPGITRRKGYTWEQ